MHAFMLLDRYSLLEMVCTATLCVAIPQTLMNVLRESVGVIRTAPTQCQDTSAPVTLGILSMRMDIHVMVRTNYML